MCWGTESPRTWSRGSAAQRALGRGGLRARLSSGDSEVAGGSTGLVIQCRYTYSSPPSSRSVYTPSLTLFKAGITALLVMRTMSRARWVIVCTVVASGAARGGARLGSPHCALLFAPDDEGFGCGEGGPGGRNIKKKPLTYLFEPLAIYLIRPPSTIKYQATVSEKNDYGHHRPPPTP